jgi:putative selenium metabolism protein SsnA
MSGWLIDNGVVVTLGAKPRVIEGGAVLTEGGVVTAVGPSARVRRKARGARRIDAEGRVVMPGLVCAHHHLYSTFARGLALRAFRPKDFLGILRGLWWKLDRTLDLPDIYWSALPPLIEGLKAGVTTVVDHHESQGAQDGSLDALAKAVEETGVRASLCLGVSDRYGRGREGVAENERFLKKRSSAERGMISPLVGLHASFTVKDETLEACVDLARRYGVGLHTHCAEDASDERHSMRFHKRRVVERLHRAGALGPDSLLVHCVHVNGRERGLLKETGTWVVHNPESNMNNAVGAADVLAFMKQGLKVALGTDGMSSHIALQARAAYLLQRHVHRDPKVAFGEALAMLLGHNAALASRLFGVRLGELSPGAAADVVVTGYRPPTPLTADNFGGHLLFGIAYAPARDVLVAGVPRLRDGAVTGLDEAETFARSRERAERFWRRMPD